MQKEKTIPVPWYIFENLLDQRRSWWDDGQHRTIPDCVWRYVIELLEDCGGMYGPEYNDPAYIVDNLVVNGSWEEFDEVRHWYPELRDLNDAELENALYDMAAVCVFPGEKIVLWNTGL